MSESPSPRPVPERLADFEVIRRLGVGGMAEVFLAKKRGAEGTFKLLVLKRVLPQHVSSRRFRAMFAEEAQLATRLNHPNIVQVYDFQDYGDEGQLLSMEYVEGPDLRRLMKSARAHGARLPPWVAAWVVGEVAKGLHYAHERRDERGNPLDIVHRDVSPQNVLLSFDGAVKVADFGIASANLFREEPGVLKGKTAYMSPEQAAGQKADRRTDIYSLGVVFHELLTGRPLHGALDGADLLEAVRAGRVEPPSTFAREVPPELESIVMRALSREPEGRFQTGRDFAAAITRTLFQRQQMVDAHVLEGIIGQLVAREHTSPGAAASARPEPHGRAETGPGTVSPSAPPPPAQQTGTGTGAVPSAGVDADDHRPSGREVRHVAVLALRLHGVEQLSETIGAANAARTVEQLRATLGEIAYKRGTRWVWDTSGKPGERATAFADSATAVVGLLSNPARAASDAAWLAIDVHEAIAGVTDDLPVALQATVGLVRGVAQGQRSAQGHLEHPRLEEPAGELAESLSAAAPPGSSWVAGGIYRLVRRDFVWGDAPAAPLAGAERGRPMRIYSLERPLTRAEKLAELAAAGGELVGRDAELGELHAAFHQAITPAAIGLGAVTSRVVYGEMGIGKTALVSAFLAELPAHARVLRVEAAPARTDLPLASVGDFMREFTGLSPGQSLEEARTVVAAALGDFASGAAAEEMIDAVASLAVGREQRVTDDAELAQQRRRIGAGLRRFFARAAFDAPLVVIVEGLQWCDRPSLELISALVRRQDPIPLLAVLVTRPEDRIQTFIDGLVRVELAGLSAENQVRLLTSRLNVEKGVAEVCADLIPRAAGNPFFLLEMVDAMLERGALEIREQPGGGGELVRAEGADARALPSTLEQLIADRLDELPAPERRLVDWLAIAGTPLSDAALGELSGAEVEEPAARLCARGVCDRRGDDLDVRHPLTRDVAYQALSREGRQRMHLALGQRLAGSPQARGLSAALVARHFALGKSYGEAARLYLEAALAARAGQNGALATRYFERVATLGQEPELLLPAHEALEATARMQGRWPERRRHLAELRRLARSSQKPEWVVRALLRTARIELDSGHLSRALTSAQSGETVARAAGYSVEVVEAETIVSEALRDLGDMQGALSACDRALSTASAPGVPARVRADVLRTRGTLLRRVGRVQEAIDAHAEAIAICRAVGAQRMEARTKNALAFALFVLARFEDAIALALEAIRIDLAIGGRFQMAKTLSNIGQCYARMGDVDRALSYLKQARAAHERYGDQDSRADTLLVTAEVLIEQGDLAAADVLVGDAGALNAVTGNAYDSVHEKILRALIARGSGDPGAAVMHAFDARQSAEAQAYVAYHFYAMAAEAAARVDIGEQHTGILLATTALGASETIRGSEYSLETRALCVGALRAARAAEADELCARSARFARQVGESIRDQELRAFYFKRPTVQKLLAHGVPTGERHGALTLSPEGQ